MKKVSLLSLIAVIALVGMVGCGKKVDTTKNDGKTKVADNQNAVGDKNLGSLTFTNVSMVYTETGTNYEATMTNTGDEKVETSYIKIKAYDAEGKQIGTMFGYVGGEIGAHETRVIDANYPSDITAAASLEYEFMN